MASLTHTPDETFQDLIQRDSDICNNCFRRTHDTFERNYVVDTFREGNETKLWAREVELPDRSWVCPDEITFVPGDEASDGTYVSCKCGIRGDPIRPVKLGHAMEHVKRIAERLDEKGVNFDHDVLLDTVRYKLSEPDNQGTQDTVFAESVELAILSASYSTQ